MNLRTAFFLVSCLWLLFPCKSRSADGYRALINQDEGFIAVSSGGRVDRITTSGKILKSRKLGNVDFNALLRFERRMCVAGDRGSLYFTTDGETFQKVECGTDNPIYSLVYFNGKILAGSCEGLLLAGDEKGAFRKLHLAVEGNIVSLSAMASECFGVTDKGEILRSFDGLNWSIFDFNAYYAGYYKPCQFTCVSAQENQLAVAGKYDDGSPLLMLSSQGTVWTERVLTYMDNTGNVSNLIGIPSSIYPDTAEDQLILVCSKGQVMFLPSCSHCNKLFSVSTEDVRSIAKNGSNWLIVGNDFQRQLLEAGLN